MYFRDSVMARTGSLTLFRWLYHVCLGLGIGHDVAEVGYTNSLSFRRAFKKVMGMPPSSYQ